jgi:hypothetical protein
MAIETLVFNGIDGKTGEYLLPPMVADTLTRVALGESFDESQVSEYKRRTRAVYALAEDRNPGKLAETGWGVIFPAHADQQVTDAIRDALGELLQHRQGEAGELYREFHYEKGKGYRRGESKNDWLGRNGGAPGTVDPTRGVPYYLLIVGDPQSIPYRFQYELDVDYAVGRIHFDTLDEYARYARTVVTAETPGNVARPRRAVFFGTTNPGDRATERSTELLIKPLAEKLAQDRRSTWQVGTCLGEDADKDRLRRLLGGDETPGLLFSASHGVGFVNGDPMQRLYQGALVCQDWQGPMAHQITRDHYLAAEDIEDSASLLGLITFHFACYSAGTPYWDDFFRRFSRSPSVVAPHAFLAALPKRLLSHPRGGALAVVGHVERAWTYSFAWHSATEQTTTFESSLKRLMAGLPIGYAMEHMNIRYASLAVSLSNMLHEAAWRSPDPWELADLWTGNNDARGYAIIGDPAVRLAVTEEEGAVVDDARIELPAPREGSLPLILDAGSLPVTTAGAAITPLDEDAMAKNQSGAETMLQVEASLTQTLTALSRNLAAYLEDATDLEVVTFVTDDVDGVRYDPAAERFIPDARQCALTRIGRDGSTRTCVPSDQDELGEALWTIHSTTVQHAQASRAEYMRIVAGLLGSFLPGPEQPDEG